MVADAADVVWETFSLFAAYVFVEVLPSEEVLVVTWLLPLYPRSAAEGSIWTRAAVSSQVSGLE